MAAPEARRDARADEPPQSADEAVHAGATGSAGEATAAEAPRSDDDVLPPDFWERPVEIYDRGVPADVADEPRRDASAGRGAAGAGAGRSAGAVATTATTPPSSAASGDVAAEVGSAPEGSAPADAAHDEAMAVLQRLFPGEIVEEEPDEEASVDDAERGESG